MFFVGIDPSLSSTAIVVIDESGALVKSKVITSKLTGPARLVEIRNETRRELIETRYSSVKPLKVNEYHHKVQVAIEHYAMGCKFNREALGELGGVLRVMLFEEDFPYIEIPPLRLKQFATGQASAEKDHILLAVYKKWGIEFKTNDEADAFILAQMARAISLVKRRQEEKFGLKLTAYEREVIEKILSPEKKAKKAKGTGEAKSKKTKKDAA